jgi:hypothetical protein
MKWNRNRHKIIAVSEAISIIEKEAYKALKANKEQGGSLVGIQGVDESIILHAIPTGPKAETSWGHIRTDAEFQNQQLADIAAHYKGSSVTPVYLADYHVHQMGLDTPSSTDDATFLSILCDPDHSYLKGLPVILATFHHGKLTHVPYWITRTGTGIKTERAELEIIAPDNQRLAAVLKGNSYAPLEEIIRKQNTTVVSLPASASRPLTSLPQGDILMTRLALEIEQIRAAFSVEAQIRRTLSGYPSLVAQVGEYRLFAVIPSEFPLNSATIFYCKSGTSKITEYNPRRTWNSIARISDVFEELLEAQANTPSVNI